MAKIAKKVRNARDEGRQQQWFQRKRRGFSNGWLKKNVNYNRPDKLFSKAPGAYVPWEPSGNVPGAGGSVSGVLADLETARTNVILNSAPTDTLAKNALDAAKTKLNALKGEIVAPIITQCDLAKTKIDLLSSQGDIDALAAIAEAKRLTNLL